MDMDDHPNYLQIDKVHKILGLAGVLVFLTLLVLIYVDSRFQKQGTKEINKQFNNESGVMRHNFKIANLNHKAFDAYLLALIRQDKTLLVESEKFIKASMGFMYVGYINSEIFRTHVGPRVEETLQNIRKYQLATPEEALHTVRGNFQSVFVALAQLEKNTYLTMQKLYRAQMDAENRHQGIYKILAVVAVAGLVLFAVLAARQLLLIKSLKFSEGQLKSYIEESKKAARDNLILTEQLHQAKKMESIGLMAGGVAHDLNNILSGIVGYPELLLRKLPQDSGLRKPIEAIRESGVRASLVVEDLLTVARGVAIAKAHHDLNELVQDYFKSPEFADLQSRHSEVEFVYNLDPGNCYINCSPVHIRKCIMNLIVNGAEAISEQGRVELTTARKSRESSPLGYKELDPGLDYICLTVTDSGSGISDHDLKHIFDPFYSKKEMGRSGTGLGLTVVWNTVQDHLGKVIVENTGNGTTILLWFPMSNEPVLQSSLIEGGEQMQGDGEHILVVDDEFHIRDMCAQMLKTMGYRVDTVPSGESALAFLDNNPVDLVILDMLMDPGMNGFQTYTEILKIYPQQKAIIASGYSESEHVKNSLRDGASQFLKKPYSMMQLGQAVKSALFA